jgi:hypothetical protein
VGFSWSRRSINGLFATHTPHTVHRVQTRFQMKASDNPAVQGHAMDEIETRFHIRPPLNGGVPERTRLCFLFPALGMMDNDLIPYMYRLFWMPPLALPFRSIGAG